MRPLATLLSAVILAGAALTGAAQPARANDKAVFGLDWRAEAEYGGFYQAVATGIYARHGLDVTIREGGPQVNHTQLLIAGRLDFNVTSNAFLALNFVRQNIPFRVVASIFQKDPAVLIAHPDQGDDSFPALKNKPIMLSGDTRVGWWTFLKARFGYTDSQIRPYTFNLAPFLADKTAIQQGYLGSEPFSIEQQGGFKPVVLLVADSGYEGYANLIGTSDKNIQQRPDYVKRFVEASIEGWYSYLYGDPTPANKLIKQANPEMTDALIAYGIKAMKQNGIVDSGDSLGAGIGAMTAQRWAAFYAATADAGVFPHGMDVTKAYTLQFVNQKAGMDGKR